MTHHPLAFVRPFIFGIATLVLASMQGLAADSATPAKSLMPEGGWKMGVHYEGLPQIQPMQVAPGQVEVIEFFWLGCPHCYAFEPALQKWQKSKPAHVKFTRVHVVWNAPTAAHARLFYALRELGREDLQDAAFEAIHKQGNPLLARTPDETLRVQTEFAKAHGIAEDAFRKAYQSPAVEGRVQNAAELGRNYRIMGVPTMAVAGKYTADLAKAGGEDHVLTLVNDLIAVEKR